MGPYAAHDPKPSLPGLARALLYGAAFVYFAHTALYAIAEHVPSYEALWARLGNVYTIHGAVMIVLQARVRMVGMARAVAAARRVTLVSRRPVSPSLCSDRTAC